MPSCAGLADRGRTRWISGILRTTLILTRLRLDYHSGAVGTLVVGRWVKDEGGGTRLQSCHGPADVPDAPAWQGGDTGEKNRTRLKQQLGCRHVGVGLGMEMADGATGPELPTLCGLPSVVVRQRCHGPFGKTVVAFFSRGVCVNEACATGVGHLFVWWSVLDVEGGAKRGMVRNDRPLFPVLKEGKEAPAAVVCLPPMTQHHGNFGCAVVHGRYLKARGKRTGRKTGSPSPGGASDAVSKQMECMTCPLFRMHWGSRAPKDLASSQLW